jgi:BirA family biotin operon repressor/biotin-[acetyl-CoA-carboxylase] ligase
MIPPKDPQRPPKLPPAYRLVALDSVGSTMAEARRLAEEEGAEDGTLIWAKEQTAGKGRQGRDWDSPRGNLYLTLVLRPECPPAQAAQLGFAAAVALGDAIGSVCPPLDVTYKWPNDVLLNGRKVAGLLLESKSTADGSLDWLLLGLGANVDSFPRDPGYPATSLRFEGTPAEVSAVDLLEAFGRHFLNWASRWVEEGFAPVRNAWLAHAAAKGKEIQVRLPNETLTGVFKDLDQDGRLLLERPEGLRTIAAGDVFPAGA